MGWVGLPPHAAKSASSAAAARPVTFERCIHTLRQSAIKRLV
jgi:hypothetical protein